MKLFTQLQIQIGLAVAAIFVAASAFAQSNGPVFIPSAKVDLKKMTATLPFYQGQLPDGSKFVFIITDASSAAAAKKLGVATSPILGATSKLSSLRKAHLALAGISTFDHGSVDFTPEHIVVPGDAPNFFPPKQFQPGSVGSGDYNPLVQIDDGAGTILNAPIIATVKEPSEMQLADGSVDYTKVHDKVLSVDLENCTVTLQMTPGFTSGKNVVYLSFDANVPLAAALEAATLTAADSQFLGSGADLNLYALTNGETGANNPQRQGFNSALSGDGSPLNILTLSPASSSYSPIWNVNVGSWTSAAISAGDRHRLSNATAVRAAASMGLITSPDGSVLGSAGIIVNCPVIQVLGN